MCPSSLLLPPTPRPHPSSFLTNHEERPPPPLLLQVVLPPKQSEVPDFDFSLGTMACPTKLNARLILAATAEATNQCIRYSGRVIRHHDGSLEFKTSVTPKAQRQSQAGGYTKPAQAKVVREGISRPNRLCAICGRNPATCPFVADFRLDVSEDRWRLSAYMAHTCNPAPSVERIARQQTHAFEVGELAPILFQAIRDARSKALSTPTVRTALNPYLRSSPTDSFCEKVTEADGDAHGGKWSHMPASGCSS